MILNENRTFSRCLLDTPKTFNKTKLTILIFNVIDPLQKKNDITFHSFDVVARLDVNQRLKLRFLFLFNYLQKTYSWIYYSRRQI